MSADVLFLGVLSIEAPSKDLVSLDVWVTPLCWQVEVDVITCNDGASSLRRWRGRSFGQPWWRAAYEELFLQWIYELFAWYEPLCQSITWMGDKRNPIHYIVYDVVHVISPWLDTKLCTGYLFSNQLFIHIYMSTQWQVLSSWSRFKVHLFVSLGRITGLDTGNCCIDAKHTRTHIIQTK